MAKKYTHIRRYKRGAKWDNGTAQLCDRCGARQSAALARGETGPPRRRQATLTANRHEHGFVMPVAYCDSDIPEDLRSR